MSRPATHPVKVEIDRWSTRSMVDDAHPNAHAREHRLFYTLVGA